MSGEILETGGAEMKQRKWAAEEKLAIVMEGPKETGSVGDICRDLIMLS